MLLVRMLYLFSQLASMQPAYIISVPYTVSREGDYSTWNYKGPMSYHRQSIWLKAKILFIEFNYKQAELHTLLNLASSSTRLCQFPKTKILNIGQYRYVSNIFYDFKVTDTIHILQYCI